MSPQLQARPPAADTERPRPALLFELPRLPKGVVALSLPAVAAAIDPWLQPELFDLDLEALDDLDLATRYPDAALCGLKVSTQSLRAARDVSRRLRALLPQALIVWGGEYPTLEPDAALEHADSVVLGPVEPVAAELAHDALAGIRGRRYAGSVGASLADVRPPRLDRVRHLDRYWQFMGLPLETSRGCDQHCTFCMVHTMQPMPRSSGAGARGTSGESPTPESTAAKTTARKTTAPRTTARASTARKSTAQLEAELAAYTGCFVNVIDYNLGVDRQHAVDVARSIGRSQATGWMGELTITALDDDALLTELGGSGCRMVYCGLETLDPDGLRSVAKRGTNDAAQYRRIIAKAQRHGVEVAAGLILGLRGTTAERLDEILAFLEDAGVIYVKLTFLTYSPGTRARDGMRRQGRYLSERPEDADGHHLTFLADGVEEAVVYRSAERFIRRFYSWRSIWRRARHVRRLSRRLEFVLFNLCFREAYQGWLRHGILQPGAGDFEGLLRAPARARPARLAPVERLLGWLRRRPRPAYVSTPDASGHRWSAQSEQPSS